ncbi:hypothetical protein [Georgenia sp. SYP-B2076]|uniref:hypothetical protein n=1 Tax=Georgenia sp. SYP-B2076 TaxID=2495881 RepID=UPI000F8F57DA|nr:hypothetical protein [Georgenia sp. SYP-B2076]
MHRKTLLSGVAAAVLGLAVLGGTGTAFASTPTTAFHTSGSEWGNSHHGDRERPNEREHARNDRERNNEREHPRNDRERHEREHVRKEHERNNEREHVRKEHERSKGGQW